MWSLIVEWCLRLAAVYAALGLCFGLAFVTRGVGRVDPTAVDGTWGFRALILPGAATLWPLLLVRWVRGAGAPPAERTAHRRAAGDRSGALDEVAREARG